MRPRLQVLDPSVVERVVDDALATLARHGTLIEDPHARERLAALGLPAGDDNRVRFPRAVVEKAHLRPRSVEDCVREAIRGAIERYGDLRDDAFLSARQDNLESIHHHTVVAERFGLLGELRGGTDVARPTTMREWLSAA